MDSYSATERAKCAAWYECYTSVVEAQRRFHAEYGRNRKAPDERTIRRWHDLLLTTCSVQNVKRTRSSLTHSDETVEKVVQHFEEDPNTSIRRAAHSLKMSRRTIQRILHDIY